jgi:2-dehydropantoate 2-reductase
VLIHISDNLQGHIWSKFVHNCAINPVSAVTGLKPFGIARTVAVSALLDRILDEVPAVVTAAGIRLPEDDPRALIHAHCQERSNRPSVLLHLESGRRTEIDAFNAALVQRGQGLGIPIPFNEAIVMILKSLEAAADQTA